MKKVTIADIIKQKDGQLRLKLDYMDRTYHGIMEIPEGIPNRDMISIKKEFVKEFKKYVKKQLSDSPDGSCRVESDKQ